MVVKMDLEEGKNLGISMMNRSDWWCQYITANSKLGKVTKEDLECAIKMGGIKDWKQEVDGDADSLDKVSSYGGRMKILCLISSRSLEDLYKAVNTSIVVEVLKLKLDLAIRKKWMEKRGINEVVYVKGKKISISHRSKKETDARVIMKVSGQAERKIVRI